MKYRNLTEAKSSLVWVLILTKKRDLLSTGSKKQAKEKKTVTGRQSEIALSLPLIFSVCILTEMAVLL